MSKFFILYDGRACGNQGTENAAILDTAETASEAESLKGDFGMMACYSYDKDGRSLINERWEWDFIPKESEGAE